jgi:6-pyruvoyltetrahydropterin/6-carboxytetrahydropterin synthase
LVVSREIEFRAFHSHHGMLTEPSHPHDFKVRVWMKGEPNEEGFIADFRAVKRLFRRIIVKELEGKNLDDYFEYATSENLAVWIWQKLEPFFPLHSIEVREKPHSSAHYFGPDHAAAH